MTGAQVEQGDPVSATGRIDIDHHGGNIGTTPSIPSALGDANAGRSTTQSRNTASELVARRYAPGGALVQEKKTGVQWAVLDYDATRAVSADNLDAVRFTAAETAVMPVGTRICYSMAVHNPTHRTGYPESPSGWFESGQTCTVVIKTPKVRFENQDVFAGKQIPTSYDGCQPGATRAPSRISTGRAPNIVGTAPGGSYAGQPANRYGSWAEFGAFATGSLAIGTATIPESQTGHQRLAFGNTPGKGSYTYPGTRQRCAPTQQLFQYTHGLTAAQTTPVGASVDLRRLPRSEDRIDLGGSNSRRVSVRTGNLTLAAASSPSLESFKRRDIILRASKSTAASDCTSGTIHINQNIVSDYRPAGGTDSYRDLTEIPRIVLLADCDIVIHRGVTRVDAWLVAGRHLITCDAGHSRQPGLNAQPTIQRLTKNDCNQPLVIDGPTFARKIYPLRTAGADLTDNPTVPAETFNLRPDALLTSYFHNRNKAPYVQVREISLPPRY